MRESWKKKWSIVRVILTEMGGGGEDPVRKPSLSSGSETTGKKKAPAIDDQKSVPFIAKKVVTYCERKGPPLERVPQRKRGSSLSEEGNPEVVNGKRKHVSKPD